MGPALMRLRGRRLRERTKEVGDGFEAGFFADAVERAGRGMRRNFGGNEISSWTIPRPGSFYWHREESRFKAIPTSFVRSLSRLPRSRINAAPFFSSSVSFFYSRFLCLMISLLCDLCVSALDSFSPERPLTLLDKLPVPLPS